MSNKPRIIAISGKSGCGNTTVSALVAEQLGFTMVNYTFRTLADDEGMSFEELAERAQRDARYDRMLDERQVAMVRSGNCVLGSRLAIWLIPDADLTVYLHASLKTRAARIMRREGNDLQRKLEETEARDFRDSERYLRIYGIDTSDYRWADLVIDTDTCDQFDAASQIVSAYRGRVAGAYTLS